METDMLDIISTLERIRDDIMYSDAEDIEDNAPTISSYLDGVITALYSDYVKDGNNAGSQG